jgi:HEAT repeat protein/energy-coupling factor transporter ATP-binding protein EcfA2
MPNKKVAKIDIVKAVAGVSFTTLAAIGSSTGHPLLAGLAAVPAAGLAAHNALGDQLARLKSQKENYLEIPSPPWWPHDIRTWQNLCAEIEHHLPHILEIMQEKMQQEQRVMTREVVRQIFVEALALQHLTWEHDVEQKRRVGEFLAGLILQKLDEVLQPVIEQIQQEGALIDERSTAQNTEQTVRVLEQIHEQVSSIARPRALNDEETATLRKQYYEALYRQWKMLDFRGIMRVDMNRPISIPLTEVFIVPDVLFGVPEYETLERETEELRYGSRTRKAKLTPSQREPLPAVLAKYRRLVLLGDPGSGKSTLLKYLLLQLVQGSDTFAATFPQMADIAAIVPLYMRLAEFAEVLLSNAPGTRSLEDFLPLYLRDHYLGAYVHFVQAQLERGNLLLLFDGLDEIPDAAPRMQVVRHIEMFTQVHAANRFIVTSRLVGYKEASLSADYQPYTLADFNEEQVKTFTQQWCPAYERWVKGTWESQYLEDAATKEAEKLFRATQSRPAVKRLAVNPLLLTILALLQRQGIELPSHRVELFDLCAMTLLGTWVKARGQSIQLSKNELIKILHPLAFWMHQHPSVGAIPEEELHEQIVRQLLERSINEYDATKIAEQFLETVHGKTGILTERGKERYGFLHLTFEEYFAAKELEKRKDRNEFIRKNLHHPRWREVIPLTAGAIGILQNNEEEVTELVYNTIAKAGSPYEWALHRDLLLAGECLADDIGIRVVCEDEIIEQIVYLALTSPYDGLQSACSKVLDKWSGTSIGEKAASLVLPLLRQWVTATDPQNTFTATTRFEKKLAEHIEQRATHYQEEMLRHLRFQLTVILARLQALERVDWVSNLLGIRSDEHERAKVLSTYRGSNRQVSIIEILLIVLSDPDPDVRKKTISALGYLGDTSPNVIDALLTALFDTRISVTRTAINAIRRLGERQPRVIDSLMTAFSYHPYTKEAAIKALWRLDASHAEMIDTLLVALVDVDLWRVRQAAANVLSRLNDQEGAIDALLTSLSDSAIDLRETVARVLGQLSSNPDTLAATLLRSLSSPTIAREVALRTLGYLGKGQPQVTQALLACLAEPNTNSRRAAIHALGQRGEEQPEIIDALVSMLSDPSFLIRYEAIQALEQLGSEKSHVIDALLLALSDLSASVRNAAITALGRLEQTQPRILDALLSAIHDPHANVRVAAATVLGRLDRIQVPVLETLVSALIGFDESTIDAAVDAIIQLCMDQPGMTSYLVTALSDSSTGSFLRGAVDDYKQRLNGSFVWRIVSLLKNVASTQPPAIDLLFTIISNNHFSDDDLFFRFFDNDFQIRREAARALGQIGKKEPMIIDQLLEVLAGSNKDASAFAAHVLEQLDKGQPRVIDALLAALPRFAEHLRANVVLALGKLGKGHPLVLDALLKAILDADWGFVRGRAAIALEQLGEGEHNIIDALLQALSGSSAWGKDGACFALGKLAKGQPSLIDALLSALSSPDSLTRFMAVRTLGDLDDKRPDLVDVLLPLLSDPHWLVRGEIARALGEHDEKLSRSVDALLLALSDASPFVRFGAAYALRNCSSGDTRVTDALLHALSAPGWGGRGAAAFALATSQNEVEAIGGRIEELFRQYEPIAHRELRDYNLVFDALREVAEKV